MICITGTSGSGVSGPVVAYSWNFPYSESSVMGHSHLHHWCSKLSGEQIALVGEYGHVRFKCKYFYSWNIFPTLRSFCCCFSEIKLLMHSFVFWRVANIFIKGVP